MWGWASSPLCGAGHRPPCVGSITPLVEGYLRSPFSSPCSAEGWKSRAAVLLVPVLGTRSSWSLSFLSAAHNLSHLRQSPTVPAHSQLFQCKMRLIPLICLSPRPQLWAPWGNYFFRAGASESNRSYPAKRVSGLQQSSKGRSSHPKTVLWNPATGNACKVSFTFWCLQHKPQRRGVGKALTGKPQHVQGQIWAVPAPERAGTAAHGDGASPAVLPALQGTVTLDSLFGDFVLLTTQFIICL